MFAWALKKVFGTSHEREIRRLRPRVEAINALEPRIAALSDAELKAKTAEFKEKLDRGATLDDIANEAFAVCREGGKRALKMRHYDVQLIGGMILNRGSIAEMRTGEGKTLVATLPCYLNALDGKGDHFFTYNDYLAKRDGEWMGRLYNFLGLSLGTVVHSQGEHDKKIAYRSDITYGQNNEFGFDYLRDNMKFSALDYAQRELNYAIVDEVDSILIDEARTPLIISGQGEPSSHKYKQINECIPRLVKDEHYVVDEKAHSVTLTDDGVELAQKLMGIGNLYDPINLESLHILNQCLRAHSLYKRDVSYLVADDGKVLIIDEFTGRVLPGRRWSDGLHQAVEAKENVRIQEETRTMATITFQNLFRIYKKLGGMTGTADTEATEFHETYKLNVITTPTNKPMIRADDQDVVYKTEREKFTAVVSELLECHEKGQPVLDGTTSVEKSNAIANLSWKKRKIPHAVLNAKHHEREAFVVAQAGRRGAITVSTNMAGRGTDILLGGNAEMIAKLEFREQNREPDGEPGGVRRAGREAFGRLQGRGRGGPRPRRPAHPRHRASRVAPHRQPASRPRRPPGRPGVEPLLSLARRRPDAHLRRRSRQVAHGADGHARQRAHRAPLGHQEHPGRAAQGRRAQLRHAKAPARVRRRDERAAKDGRPTSSVSSCSHRHPYKPEKIDEDGKPTGEMRDIRPDPRIAEEVKQAILDTVIHHGTLRSGVRCPGVEWVGGSRARRRLRPGDERHRERRREEGPAEDRRRGRRDLLDGVAAAGRLPVLGLPPRLQGHGRQEAQGHLRTPRGGDPAEPHRAARAAPRPARRHRRRDRRGVLPPEQDAGGLGLEGHQERLHRALCLEAARRRAPARPRADREGAVRGRGEEGPREGEGDGHGAPAPRLPSLLSRGHRQAVGRAPHEHGAPARRHSAPSRPTGSATRSRSTRRRATTSSSR